MNLVSAFTNEIVIIRTITKKAECVLAKSNQDNGMTTKRAPIQRICKSCGISFTISSGEQDFYESHQLDLPKRCKKCRENERNKKTQIAQDKQWKQDEIDLSKLLLKTQFC